LSPISSNFKDISTCVPSIASFVRSETGDIFILIENGPQLAKQTSEINNKTINCFLINVNYKIND